MAVVTSSVKPRPADTWSLAKLCARYEGTTLKVLGVVSALGLWQLAVATGRVSPMVISSPSRIVVAGLDYVTSHQFAIDATTSGLEFIGGFGLAVIVGIVLGFAMGWSKRIENFLDPCQFASKGDPHFASNRDPSGAAGLGLSA